MCYPMLQIGTSSNRFDHPRLKNPHASYTTRGSRGPLVVNHEVKGRVAIQHGKGTIILENSQQTNGAALRILGVFLHFQPEDYSDMREKLTNISVHGPFLKFCRQHLAILRVTQKKTKKNIPTWDIGNH